jgi:hypothetical protein
MIDAPARLREIHTQQSGQEEIDELRKYTTFASGDKGEDHPAGSASTISGSTNS